MASVATSSVPIGDCQLQTRRANQVCDSRALHRIAEVREQQGMSLRTVSRRTGVDLQLLKQQELPSSDLSLSELYRWQQALEIPIQFLLEDHDGELSNTTQTRASLIKLMKTVIALSEVASTPRVTRLVTMLREQMIEIMPELADIGGWPNYGSRRPSDHQGRIAENPIDVNSLSID